MKNNADLLRQLMDDDRPLADDLQAELDAELTKPDASRDLKKIAELTGALAGLNGCAPGDGAELRCIEAAEEDCRAQAKRRGISRLLKGLSAVAACAAVCCVLNIFTLNTFGEGLISTVVQFTRNGFSLDLIENENGWFPWLSPEVDSTETPSTLGPAPSTPPDELIPTESPTDPLLTTPPGGGVNPDPAYQYICLGDVIESVCTENKCTPCRLDYDAEVRYYTTDYQINELSSDFYFDFNLVNDQRINVNIEFYNDKDDIPTSLIPFDDPDRFIARKSDVGNVYFFCEDDYTTAIFINGSAVYTTTGYNMDYVQMEKLIFMYTPAEEN